MGYDGASATATHLSNLHITPIEILESEFPCRITRFEFVPDSGGAGRRRGRLSLLSENEVLENASLDIRSDKSPLPPARSAGRGVASGAHLVTWCGPRRGNQAADSGGCVSAG